MIPMLKKELREGELQFGPSAKKKEVPPPPKGTLAKFPNHHYFRIINTHTKSQTPKPIYSTVFTSPRMSESFNFFLSLQNAVLQSRFGLVRFATTNYLSDDVALVPPPSHLYPHTHQRCQNDKTPQIHLDHPHSHNPSTGPNKTITSLQIFPKPFSLPANTHTHPRCPNDKKFHNTLIPLLTPTLLLTSKLTEGPFQTPPNPIHSPNNTHTFPRCQKPTKKFQNPSSLFSTSLNSTRPLYTHNANPESSNLTSTNFLFFHARLIRRRPRTQHTDSPKMPTHSTFPQIPFVLAISEQHTYVAVSEPEIDPDTKEHTGFHTTVWVPRPNTEELRIGGVGNRDTSESFTASLNGAIKYCQHYMGMAAYVQFESVSIVPSKNQKLGEDGQPALDKQGQVQLSFPTFPTQLTYSFFQPIMNAPQGTIRVLPHLVPVWTSPAVSDQLAVYLKRRLSFAPYVYPSLFLHPHLTRYPQVAHQEGKGSTLQH